MKKVGSIFFIAAILSSCTSDPKDKDGNTDSIIDTASVVMGNNDTFRIDSGNSTKTYYDCSILNKRIPSDTAQATIRRDLAQLIHCGIDSFDFLYVVPNLFPGFVSENQVSGTKVLYGDFVKHVNEFKATEAYFQLHQRVSTLDSLRSTKYDHAKLHLMKPTLGKLGFTEPEWEMFSGFANSYPVPAKGKFTWGDMLDAFDKYKPK
ncbi:hypothetical protein BH09BAC5_BH09BAC5_25050 [soil metagenome]